jgi:diacylglycerol kinase family enzyme
MCSAGIDAEVVRRVSERPRVKRRLGRVAFAWPSLRAVIAGRATGATIVADGESAYGRLLVAVAGNTRLYGGLLHLTGDARIDDGLLDLVTFEEPGGWMPGPLRRVLLTLRAGRGGLATARTRGIEYRRVRELTIVPERALPVQADGEYIGDCSPGAPLRIAIDPAAIEVVLGRRPTALLGETPI